MRGFTALLIVALLGTWTQAVQAHHGVAAVGVAGPEGPGAALETTSAMPLPGRTAFAMLKSETVSFQHRDFAEPENKDYSLFNMAALGYGILPWLSAYVFQPFNVKSQDSIGTNAGLGDTNLMLTFAFKYDEGLKVLPEKESLDELMDWHFMLWVSSTLPVGPIERDDDVGERFAPDMQTGFGAPSPAVGFAVLKQLSEDFTWLADVNYQHFFPYSYSYTRYCFGGETRLDTALTYRLVGAGSFRMDLVGELLGLNLQRDQERNESGDMEKLEASGGTMLYAGLGTRLFYGRLSAALGIRRAALKSLNEGSDQQGSEGLENFRAALTVSYSLGL
jgi:hypothetical protein